MNYTLSEVPAGRAGTDLTLKAIGQGIGRSSRRPHVRLKALDILRRANIPDRRARATARALFNWVRRNIRFVPDPLDIETIQDPEITLRLGAGDCDDHAALLAALAQSVGMPARFVVIGEDSDHLQHIYAEIFVDGRWTPADTTVELPFGVSPPPLPATKVYSMKGDLEMKVPLSLSTRRAPVPSFRATPVAPAPVPVELVKRTAYLTAMRALTDSWGRGRINRRSLYDCLRIIDVGRSPARGTVIELPMRKAIQDFLATVNARRTPSFRSSHQLSGLGDVGDWLESLYNTVKDGVSAAVKYGQYIFGSESGQPGPYQIQPTIQIPTGLIQAQIPPGTAAAGVGAILSSPIFIGLAVIGVALLLSGRKR